MEFNGKTLTAYGQFSSSGGSGNYKQPEWGDGLVEITEDRYCEWNDELSTNVVQVTAEEYENILAAYAYIGADTYGEMTIDSLGYDPDAGVVMYGEDFYITVKTQGKGIKRIPSEYVGTLEQPVWGKGLVDSTIDRYAEWSGEIAVTPEEYENIVAAYRYEGADTYVGMSVSDLEYDPDAGVVRGGEEFYITIRTKVEGIAKIPSAYVETAGGGGGSGGGEMFILTLAFTDSHSDEGGELWMYSADRTIDEIIGALCSKPIMVFVHDYYDYRYQGVGIEYDPFNTVSVSIGFGNPIYYNQEMGRWEKYI